jgi:hypothetical protein
MPGLLGLAYFCELATLIRPGSPPNPAHVREVMLRHGLVPVSGWVASPRVLTSSDAPRQHVIPAAQRAGIVPVPNPVSIAMRAITIAPRAQAAEASCCPPPAPTPGCSES